MAKSERHLSTFDLQILHAIGEGKNLGSDGDPAIIQWPNLWQWLSTVYAGKEYVKQPANMTIRLGPAGVLVAVVDRDLSVSCETSCQFVGQAFDAIEAVLATPSAPIKSWGRKEPKLRKRRQ